MIVVHARAQMAKNLKMTDAQVKTWFQNRRTKWRSVVNNDHHQTFKTRQYPIWKKRILDVEYFRMAKISILDVKHFRIAKILILDVKYFRIAKILILAIVGGHWSGCGENLEITNECNRTKLAISFLLLCSPLLWQEFSQISAWTTKMFVFDWILLINAAAIFHYDLIGSLIALERCQKSWRSNTLGNWKCLFDDDGVKIPWNRLRPPIIYWLLSQSAARPCLWSAPIQESIPRKSLKRLPRFGETDKYPTVTLSKQLFWRYQALMSRRTFSNLMFGASWTLAFP